jgi:PPK2 family polyphosphate:nucleotide phosphotransferase
MDYARHFAVAPGTKVKLKDFDPGFRGKHENAAAAGPEIAENLETLRKLQFTLYAERGHSLLIVLQGIDAAGKDGVCRHVISAMSPQGCDVVGFKQPTPEERGHDFLWRVHRHTPELGRVAIFNRSHYEDVLVVRVHKLVPKDTWQARYEHINAFERLLVDSGTTVLKFFLWISKDEQLARFKDRLEDPARQWKISDSDYTERAYWDDYGAAYEDMLERCSTAHAPWYVIPSNHKWFRNLAVSSIIAQAMEGMKMQMPRPTVDLAAIRKAYHKAAQE